MSSVFGKNLIVTIFGQSHSKAIGVCLDNLPAGFEIDMEDLSDFMKRRSSINKPYSTKRKEKDQVEFLSGLVGNTTCGAPLCAIIYNNDIKPQDYESIKNILRPSHADYTAQMKYKGYQDPTGGGHFSGRMTAPLCIAGAICLQILKSEGIKIHAHIKKIYDVEDISFNPIGNNEDNIKKLMENDFPVIDINKGILMQEQIHKASQNLDSLGGIIECAVYGLPAGIGDPMFDGIENNISKAIFAIPAVKGIEFGNGFSCADLKGSENNDAFYVENNKVLTKTNNHGGILGGISSGMPLIFKVALKATPSIGIEQDSVNLSQMKNEKLRINGRHDPCIVPRAVPCVEAAAAIALLDMFMSFRIWR
ncbi:MAG TPA: chorismate synthase [Clostridia bacterium]|nr:MAG: Chorismate synthase [Firmicutes bacterium ADurb.Bin146]HOD93492.1 chorismate synthase [Clostridia bacterium]HQM39792.1 chorismate synthase [Clostridia bacterium]